MYLLVGLGNPGKKYERTRHNVGFLVADAIAEIHRFSDFKEKFSGVWTKGDLGNHEVAVLKPQTFMNLSGDSVQPAQTFLKVEPSCVVVIHDELDVPFGEVRVKFGGGHGGHNGLRSIIERFGHSDFTRVRVGIGRPPPEWRGDVADFVLQKFEAEEAAALPNLIRRAQQAVEAIVQTGVQAAMTSVNQKAPPRNSQKKPKVTEGEESSAAGSAEKKPEA